MDKHESRPAIYIPEAGVWRQRVFAWALAHLNKKYEKFVAEYKRRLFATLTGTVLEIGPGTGANLQHFPKDHIRWIGIEPSPFMYRYLTEEANRLEMQIEVRNGAAESLPVPDSSLDAVVSTLVLCCFTELQLSLREVLRVLKPGGKFVFIEHIAAPRGTWLRHLQNCVSPIWRRMGDGCHPDRETWIGLRQVGFDQLTYETFLAPVPIVSLQIMGIAVKGS